MGVKPNTALLLIVSLAVLRGGAEGAAVGFFAGLLWDLSFGGFAGLFALTGSVIGWFCGIPFAGFYKDNYVFPALLALVSCFVWEFAFYLAHLWRAGVGLADYAVRAALPGAAYTMILCVPVFLLVFWINGKLDRKKSKPAE